jgi:hypothetical protein
MCRSAAAVAFTALTACGPIPQELGDSDGIDFGRPARPAPPVLTPCPDGWIERAGEDGLVRCDPWPELGHAVVMTPCPDGWRHEDSVCRPWPQSGRATCTSTEAHFPGEPGCRGVGSVCADRFPEDLADGPDVAFVLAGSNGDGTRAAPFGTIAEALATAASVIAIGPGVYEEVLSIERSVELRGACAGRTTITSSSAVAPLVEVTAPGVAVRDISFVSSSSPGIRALRATGLAIEGVLIDDVSGYGIGAFGESSVTVRDVIIRGIRYVDPELGHGVTVAGASSTEIDGLVVEDVPEIGLLAHGDGTSVRAAGVLVEAETDGAIAVTSAQLELSRSVLEGAVRGLGAGASARVIASDLIVTESGDDEWSGVSITSSASLDAVRLLVEASRNVGVSATTNASLFLEHSIIRDTDSNLEGRFGRGIEISRGATAELRNVLVERNRHVGIAILHGGAAVVDRVTVRDTAGQRLDGRLGIGIEVWEASAEITRALLARNHANGVALVDATRAVLEHVVVRETDEQPVGAPAGFGVATFRGSIDLAKIAIDGSRGGIFISGSTISVAEDLLVERSQAATSGQFGRGAEIQKGARASLVRAAFLGSASDGVFISNSIVSLADVRVSDTHGGPRPAFGRGISVYRGSRVTMERIQVDESRDIGIVGLMDSEIVARHVRIADSVNRDCPPGSCGGQLTGLGAAVAGASTLRLSGFSIERASLCGVLIGNGSSADLETGDVTNCEIGVCLFEPDYDVARLQKQVVYAGNDTNLDAVDLVLPDAGAEGVLPEPE